MSRRGHYHGGPSSGDMITDLFRRDSMSVPPHESGPRPPRSPAEQAEYDAFARKLVN